ncbi:restriction endonuclease subunit S [Pseudomonas sp. dw_358]|uniref:restriction endonuclease subunit S n=1 Tax=Pseudomonas sp. dw_358 TaxID=2720083 RepID=UPI002116F74A|nr:restriction endonuclease subunit S [Pseudomonas sp. dw_358]
MTSNDIPANWLILGFDEVFSQISISGKKVKSADVLTEGKFPVVDQGRSFISGYLDDASFVVSENKPLIIFGDHTREVKWIDFPFIPGADGVQVLKPHPEIDTRFLYFFLRNLPIESRGYARHFKIVKDAAYLVPPFAEQTRIAAKLDELLAQVDTLKARIDSIPALLKRFRQSVLAAAVSGRLTEEWRTNSPPMDKGSELHQQIKNAHIAEGGHARGNASNPTEEAHDLSSDDLPDSWDIAELRDVCVPGRPITYGILKPGPELEEGVPYIRVADFPGNKLNITNIKKTSSEIDQQFKRARLLENDLLLSIRGSVGRLIKIPASLEGANITQDTARLSISPLISTDFVYWALLADSTQRRMKNATRGVAVRGINIGDVRALQIPLPPHDEQAEIVRRVEQLFAFADQLEARIKAAQVRIDLLTQSILAEAFRGELVPQDPNDEPASVLLERIKAQRAAMPKAKRGRQVAKLS